MFQVLRWNPGRPTLATLPPRSQHSPFLPCQFWQPCLLTSIFSTHNRKHTKEKVCSCFESSLQWRQFSESTAGKKKTVSFYWPERQTCVKHTRYKIDAENINIDPIRVLLHDFWNVSVHIARQTFFPTLFPPFQDKKEENVLNASHKIFDVSSSNSSYTTPYNVSRS